MIISMVLGMGKSHDTVSDVLAIYERSYYHGSIRGVEELERCVTLLKLLDQSCEE